ncbi:hypothetical protein GCM10011344_27400 [Dokdonia pacifica]|uniref:Uncharacterized protein n=1 Tax=Dokdonia pacifica TaxID=1627892 RepID=A0A239E5S3_9FLAO|nr:hypothetical protein [Dokdonia pacifica]GGG25253.1 hypothetical protein GCM10011344_27400 [Dokdonia pacifica]SNS39648.1 hypothetical protein SAMN06265376_1144 [Dokdonia pacifica]
MLRNLILTILIVQNIYGQDYFEGEILYNVTYESLDQNISSSILEREMGKSFSAYIKEDKYQLFYDAKGKLGWIKVSVFLNEGYTLTEYEKSDTLIKSPFGSQKEKLIDFKVISSNQKEVLGKMCKSILIHYESLNENSFFKEFRGTYYYYDEYKLNPKLYEKYTDGFWNLYVKESESVSLRNETEFLPFFRAIQEAVKITPKKIPDTIFNSNPNKYLLIE